MTFQVIFCLGANIFFTAVDFGALEKSFPVRLNLSVKSNIVLVVKSSNAIYSKHHHTKHW